jgi:hypothetical protein
MLSPNATGSQDQSRILISRALTQVKSGGPPGAAWLLRVESKPHMARRQSNSQPGWANVKAKLATFDRPALLGLVQDLYVAHKENQAFLHARFGLGKNVLEPYMKAIDRGLWPDVSRRQDTSVLKAKQAIADYKKALGDAEGMAELMVFYCERAAGFSRNVSHEDAGYFDALVRMFEQALKTVNTLAANVQGDLIARVERVRNISREFGYGIADDMDVLLSEFVPTFRRRVLHRSGQSKS